MVSTVLDEPTLHDHTVSLKTIAHQFSTATAVKAFVTKLGIVSDNAVTAVEILDLGSKHRNDTDSLMSRNERGLYDVLLDVLSLFMRFDYSDASRHGGRKICEVRTLAVSSPCESADLFRKHRKP